MPLIELQTKICAPIERVFDLARSIDAHTNGAENTGERAIAGRTTGLIDLGETVTWEARHFRVRQQLTVRITEFDRPQMFADEMVSGAFKSMQHRHSFSMDGVVTTMDDRFEFAAPLGILGWIAERLFLTRYMTRFLETRNLALKRIAESDEWQRFLAKDTDQMHTADASPLP